MVVARASVLAMEDAVVVSGAAVEVMWAARAHRTLEMQAVQGTQTFRQQYLQQLWQGCCLQRWCLPQSLIVPSCCQELQWWELQAQRYMVSLHIACMFWQTSQALQAFLLL